MTDPRTIHPSEQLCRNCYYLREVFWHGGWRHHCRFTAPVQGGSLYERWPVVQLGDWCGQWAPVAPPAANAKPGLPPRQQLGGAQ